MSWGNLEINAYRNADLTIIFEVEHNGAAYEFADGIQLGVYTKWEKTPTLSPAFAYSVVGTKGIYTAQIPKADLSALVATIYPTELMSGDRVLKTGNFNLSDVYEGNWSTATSKITVTDAETYEVTLSDSDTAAALAIAAQTAAETAQTAAELAQTGAETAETNAEGHETAASGFATDALGHANDAEASAETALTTIKGVRNIVASETLVIGDAGFLIEAEHADTKINVTIPADVFPNFTTIAVERTGLAEVEIIAGGATVINGGRNISEQYHIVTLQNKGGNVWTCIGGVS